MDKTSDKVEASNLRDVIIKYPFLTQFSYFNEHKGDVWDSLNLLKASYDVDRAKEYKIIMDFVEEARRFDRSIANLKESLERYLESPQNNRMVRK